MEELYHAKLLDCSFCEVTYTLISRADTIRPASFVYNLNVFYRYLKYPVKSFFKRPPEYFKKMTRERGRQVFTAGGKDEQVIEKPEWGHSAFTLNLNRGLKDGNADLNSDGYITANELGLFLSEKVTIDSENQQTPQYGRMTSQEGEFVFINKNIMGCTISSSDTDAKLNLLISEKAELKESPVVTTTHPDK